MNEKSVVSKERKQLALNIAFMVLCGVSGVFIKHLINPVSNVITGFFHVPGGVSTAVSVMLLVIAAGVTGKKWCAGLIGIAQGMTALSIGMVGSMGVLIPLAYFIPGFAIDLIMLIPEKGFFGMRLKAFLANIASSVSAALFANFMVFHLPTLILTVYLCLAAVTGAICGCLAGVIIKNVKTYIEKDM